jgi:hypothetical protein
MSPALMCRDLRRLGAAQIDRIMRCAQFFFDRIFVCRNSPVAVRPISVTTNGEIEMYPLGTALMSSTKKLTEKQLFQQDDLTGLGRRLAVAFAAIALLILSLNAAYHHGGQLQTMAAHGPAAITPAE